MASVYGTAQRSTRRFVRGRAFPSQRAPRSGCGATAADWEPFGGEVAIPPETGVPRALSATEIRDRYAGQIVEGVHEIRNFAFTHYYGPACALISTRSDRQKTHGTWHVDDDDRLCIHLNGDDEICRGVIEIDGVTRKFVDIGRGRTKFVVTFKSFRTGGPDDL